MSNYVIKHSINTMLPQLVIFSGVLLHGMNPQTQCLGPPFL